MLPSNELCYELLPPIVCNIFFLAVLGTNEQVHVVPEFVVERVRNGEIPQER